MELESFFSIPLVRPRARELLNLVKHRADYTQILEEYESQDIIFILNENREICFSVSNKFSENQILEAIDAELIRHKIDKTSDLNRKIRIGVIKYQSILHQMNYFEQEIVKIKQQEREMLDAICSAFEQIEEL